MNVEGEITEQDFVQAQWLHIKPRRSLRVLGRAGVALFALMVSLALFHLVSQGHLSGAAAILGPPAVVLFLGGALRWQYRRTYRRQPSLQGTFSYEISDTGFSVTSPHGRGEASWSAFTKWREGPTLFLLYQGDHVLQMLPKRWFGSDTSGAGELRAILARRSIPSVD